MQIAASLLRRHGGELHRRRLGWRSASLSSIARTASSAVAWSPTWDTEDDARDFARQYTRFQTTKMGPNVNSPDAFPDSIRRPHEGIVYAVERRGKDVAVVEGFASTEIRPGAAS